MKITPRMKITPIPRREQMKPLLAERNLLKKIPNINLHSDFRFSIIALMVLCLLVGLGVLLQVVLYPSTDTLSVVYIIIGVLCGSIGFVIMPTWRTSIALMALSWIIMFAVLDTSFALLFLFISIGLLTAPAFQLVQHWDKAVILRLGKFRALKGPGLFMIFPLIDSVTEFIDTRIRATDFRAETTLTRDTVPVNVDAIAFWMIWDARKAVLEVESFIEAVILSSQAALRDAIGKHDLATLLTAREELGKRIQRILDAKTNPWGITILSIDISDIIIPKELEDAMSKQAQAERERQSRVILGTAEVEISEKFEEASRRYRDNPTALHLRAMNMIYEGLRKHGSLVLLPSTALESMSLGTTLGAVALEKTGMAGNQGDDGSASSPDTPGTGRAGPPESGPTPAAPTD
jgi:regulator of protease activity HflC (stomatin/prohibitin superfamily)